MSFHHFNAIAWICMFLCAIVADAAKENEIIMNIQDNSSTSTVESSSSPLSSMSYDSVRRWSYHLCRADVKCARRFFVDDVAPNQDQFNYLFDRFVVETESKKFLIDHFNSSCPAVRDGWMLTMKLASFCSDNEILDGDGYCTCRNGKVCHEAPSKKYSFDIVSLNVLFCIFLGVVLYYSISLLRRLGHLEEAAAMGSNRKQL